MPIFIYQGDDQRLSFHSNLLERTKHPCVKTMFFYDLKTEDLQSADQDDLFQQNPKDIVCVVLNNLKLKTIPKLDKNFYLHLYNPVRKNSKIIKETPEKNIETLKPILDGFGGIDEREFSCVKTQISEYFKSVPKYSNYVGKIEQLASFYLRHTQYSGVINDIEACLEVEDQFGVGSVSDVVALTDPNNQTEEAMSILTHVQNMDKVEIFGFMRKTKVEYASIVVGLQSMFYNLSRVLNAYREENYEIDFNDLPHRVPGIKKYTIYKSMKMIKSFGVHHINYIYNYLSHVLAKECGGIFPYSREVKMMDLCRVVSGMPSVLFG